MRTKGFNISKYVKVSHDKQGEIISTLASLIANEERVSGIVTKMVTKYGRGKNSEALFAGVLLGQSLSVNAIKPAVDAVTEYTTECLEKIEDIEGKISFFNEVGGYLKQALVFFMMPEALDVQIRGDTDEACECCPDYPCETCE